MSHTYDRTQPRTPQQHQRLFGLLGKLGYGEDTRRTLVHSFTNGRTTSSKEMLAFECNLLINHLEGMVPKEDNPLFFPRRKVFAVCHELGWERKDGTVDRARLEAFIEKRGAVKKPFLEHTAKELAQLITQLERISAKQPSHG